MTFPDLRVGASSCVAKIILEVRSSGSTLVLMLRGLDGVTECENAEGGRRKSLRCNHSRKCVTNVGRYSVICTWRLNLGYPHLGALNSQLDKLGASCLEFPLASEVLQSTRQPTELKFFLRWTFKHGPRPCHPRPWTPAHVAEQYVLVLTSSMPSLAGTDKLHDLHSRC